MIIYHLCATQRDQQDHDLDRNLLLRVRLPLGTKIAPTLSQIVFQPFTKVQNEMKGSRITVILPEGAQSGKDMPQDEPFSTSLTLRISSEISLMERLGRTTRGRNICSHCDHSGYASAHSAFGRRQWGLDGRRRCIWALRFEDRHWRGLRDLAKSPDNDHQSIAGVRGCCLFRLPHPPS